MNPTAHTGAAAVIERDSGPNDLETYYPLMQTEEIESDQPIAQPELSRSTLQKVQVLRATTLFGNLPESTLNPLTDCFSFRSLQKGEVLYSEQDEASCLYVVADGELRSIR